MSSKKISREDALAYHSRGRKGKIQVVPTKPTSTQHDLSLAYSPGVAYPCLEIAKDPLLAYEHTAKGNLVGVISNGTAVLGLGNIGALAGKPVMEGKGVLFKRFADIDVFDIEIATRDTEQFINAVKVMEPTFGGINLEDIAAPECFEIEERLIAELEQPVMHDDVHGTAVVVLAAALCACARTGTELGDATVGHLGLGAAGYGIASLMVEAAERVVGFDPDTDNAERASERGVETVDEVDAVIDAADLLVATTGRADSIDPDRIRDGQIVLALSNPDPEIEPGLAREAGAAFAADGSMVNNVLGYPGIFRGALLAGAPRIESEMKLAAARTLSELAGEDRILPDVLDREVHERVAEAVRDAAPEREAAGSAGR
ncbi:MAG: hypothetical protein DMF53_13430 [Acidobacteria bacterium]|nr:MAG: hypothetical protein DMF53_13430 [Acidobacteriota bacterium]